MAKGYGVRKMGESARVDENTLFGIGSNTKAFTTAALATLLDEGKISWDDKVYERLRGFEMYDPYVSHEMTIGDLLTHRSGMGLGEGDLLFWPHSTFTRGRNYLQTAIHEASHEFPQQIRIRQFVVYRGGTDYPGGHGKVVGRVRHGKDSEAVGMKTTTLSNAHFPAGANIAWPHSKIGEPLRPIDFVGWTMPHRRVHQFFGGGDVALAAVATESRKISR